MVGPTPYEYFNTAGTTYVYIGGGVGSYSWPRDSWCLGYYCLLVELVSPVDSGTYLRTWYGNLSVEMDKFGHAASLPFTWSYEPLFCGNNTVPGTTVPIHLALGETTFDSQVPSVDFNFFQIEHLWNPGSNITYNGTLPMTLSSDGVHAFIPVTISFTMKSNTPYERLMFYIRGMSIQLFQPPSPSASSTSTDTSSLPSSTTQSSTSSQSATVPGGAIAGAAIGALLLIALVLGIWWFVRKRSKQSTSPAGHTSDAEPDTAAHLIPSTWGGLQPPVTIPDWNLPSSTPNTNRYPEYDFSERSPTAFSLASDSLLAGSATQHEDSHPGLSNHSLRRHITQPVGPRLNHSPRAADDPPPNYSVSTAVASWANANRALITPDMEQRLIKAGHVPGSNPDDLTEEEWETRYGITKSQLTRLREIYANNHTEKQCGCEGQSMAKGLIR